MALCADSILRACLRTIYLVISDDQAKGLCEDTAGATLEHRHQLMNTEATVDNNFELFEAQRVEEIKVTCCTQHAIQSERLELRRKRRVDHVCL